MRLDYDARLRLRRVAGVVVPVLLVPIAVWSYAVTPSASPVGPVRAAPDLALRADVRADGSFDVVETLRLAEPVVQVRLTPPDLTTVSSSFAQVAPVWAGVEVVAADQDPVLVPELGGAVTVPLPAPTTTVEIRYRLTGAAVRTVPSFEGRAMGALAPLSDVDGLVVGFEVAGAGVRTLTCPRLPGEQVLCAVDEHGTFVTRPPLPLASAVVVAQLDLGA